MPGGSVTVAGKTPTQFLTVAVIWYAGGGGARYAIVGHTSSFDSRGLLSPLFPLPPSLPPFLLPPLTPPALPGHLPPCTEVGDYGTHARVGLRLSLFDMWEGTPSYPIFFKRKDGLYYM